MKLGLISMPWLASYSPSPAVGALAAYVARELPEWEVYTSSAHVTAATAVGWPVYQFLEERVHAIGELLYMAQLYPEQTEAVRGQFVRWAEQRVSQPGEERSPATLGFATWGDLYDHLHRMLTAHLDATAADAGEMDVIGLTTTYCQLFASLCLARRLKDARPAVRIILGGATVSSRIGPSVLREYPFVDHIVVGEGELPLVALLRTLAQGEGPAALPGVLSREAGDRVPDAAQGWELTDLDSLPVPDYDEYAQLVQDAPIDWRLPLESARGCWWNRVAATGNPRRACHFCNMNLQWGRYREKSIPRFLAELEEQSARYERTDFELLDNIMRHRGVEELAQGLIATGREFSFFCEARVSLRPRELVALWEAGCNSFQFGIEGLSDSLLRRIGKGTSVIQNLQIMRLCTELGLLFHGNLLTGFPSATPEEVAETLQVIRQSAWGFSPCKISRFQLAVGSTVELLRDAFGLTGFRNSDLFRLGLPPEVWERLSLIELDATPTGPRTDWSSVEQLCVEWQRCHAGGERPRLQYRDGGTFLRLWDRRYEQRLLTLRGAMREVYLSCLEISTFEQLARCHCGPSFTEANLRETLAELMREQVLFGRAERYLSLATATRPDLAVRRIRRTRATGAGALDEPS